MQGEIAGLKHEHEKSIDHMKAKIAKKDASLEEQNQAMEGLEREKKQLELEASKYQVCTVLFYDGLFCCVPLMHPSVWIGCITACPTWARSQHFLDKRHGIQQLCPMTSTCVSQEPA